MFQLLGMSRALLGAFILLCLRLFCMSVQVCECHYVHLCARQSRRIRNCVRACISTPAPPLHPRGCSMYPLTPGPSPTSLRLHNPTPLPFYFSPALPLLRGGPPHPPLPPPAAPPLALFTHDTLNQDEKKLMQLMHLLSHCLAHPRRWRSR